jgi:hypothetical protein
VDLAATSLEIAVRRIPVAIAPKLRLVAGLTAAPPAALVATTRGSDPPRTVASLARRRVGIPAPGIDETWLGAMLARAKLGPRTVRIVSLGVTALLAAIESGEIDAAYLEDPYATDLVTTGRATVLADLRSAKAAAETIDAPTVHAAVFARADRLPDARHARGVSPARWLPPKHGSRPPTPPRSRHGSLQRSAPAPKSSPPDSPPRASSTSPTPPSRPNACVNPSPSSAPACPYPRRWRLPSPAHLVEPTAR